MTRASRNPRWPRVCEGLFFSSAGLTLLLAAVLLLGTSSVLHCSNGELRSPQCELQISTFGVRLRTRDLEGVTRAKLRQINASGGVIWIVVLQTAEGEIPVSDFSNLGYSEKKELTDQLNVFLDNWNQSNLVISSYTRSLLIMLLAVAFGFLGVVLLAYGLGVRLSDK